MYVATLTSLDIDFGKRVAQRLHGTGLGIKGIFWLYDDVTDDWRLVIAAEAVDRIGPRETYIQIAKLLLGVGSSDFQRMRIEAVSPKTPLLQALRSVFGTAATVEGARLQGTVVNGIRVPEAYLYEIAT